MKVRQMMADTSWWILVAIFPTCSFAGLAALLRSDQPLTRRSVLSALLNSGLLGVSVAALMLHRFGSESLTLIIAVSLLSGLGGNTAVDFCLEALRSYVRRKEDD